MRSTLATFARTALSLSGRDRRIISVYLAAPGPHKLQIGCGGHPLPGWLNTNFPISLRWSSLRARIIRLDATRRFPLPDASLDFIHSAHMIEHVPFSGGAAMLAECFRTLKPGGTIRLATPNLQFLLDLLRAPLDELQRDYVAWAAAQFLAPGEPATPVAVANNFMRAWGHQFIYDRQTLADLLHSNGFTCVTPCEVDQSEHPELSGIDRPSRMPTEFYALETMTFEAVKPA